VWSTRKVASAVADEDSLCTNLQGQEGPGAQVVDVDMVLKEFLCLTDLEAVKLKTRRAANQKIGLDHF